MHSKRSEPAGAFQAPILRDIPWQRRILALSSLFAANALGAVTRAKRNGNGDGLIAFANLGDQLRMMNVLSRYNRKVPIDVYCNAGTEHAFRLYPDVASVRGYANQGAGILVASARRALSGTAVYRRALIPHPFITQPLALCAAKAFAAETEFLTSLPAHDRGAVPLSRESWRAAYEAFFSHVFAEAPVYDKPQILPQLRFAPENAPSRIAVHFMTSAASRSITASLWGELLDSLRGYGMQIVALGSKAEEERIAALCRPRAIEMWCGRPLSAVAALLAQSRLFIGLDSSMMNLADAVGVPSVVVYVRTSAAVAGPYYSPSYAVAPRSGYAPVGVDPMVSWTDLPPSGDVTVEQILEGVESMLRTPSKS